MKPVTVKDHQIAAQIYNKSAAGKELNFKERNIITIYEKKLQKAKKKK